MEKKAEYFETKKRKKKSPKSVTFSIRNSKGLVCLFLVAKQQTSDPEIVASPRLTARVVYGTLMENYCLSPRLDVGRLVSFKIYIDIRGITSRLRLLLLGIFRQI